jgi:hypothetical protein
LNVAVGHAEISESGNGSFRVLTVGKCATDDLTFLCLTDGFWHGVPLVKDIAIWYLAFGMPRGAA